MISELHIGRCASEETKPRKSVDTRQCASKDAWPRKGDWGVPHRLGKGTSASEDTGLRREVDCEIPHWLERVWKSLPSRRVLKILKEARKGMPKEDNIC